jgi:hypothetical protein
MRIQQSKVQLARERKMLVQHVLRSSRDTLPPLSLTSQLTRSCKDEGNNGQDGRLVEHLSQGARRDGGRGAGRKSESSVNTVGLLRGVCVFPESVHSIINLCRGRKGGRGMIGHGRPLIEKGKTGVNR